MKKIMVLIGVLGLILMIALSAAAQSTTMIGGSIRFAPGATSQVISGRLDGGVAVRYEFYASANQSANDYAEFGYERRGSGRENAEGASPEIEDLK